MIVFIKGAITRVPILVIRIIIVVVMEFIIRQLVLKVLQQAYFFFLK
jgi:hypothetical protein